MMESHHPRGWRRAPGGQLHHAWNAGRHRLRSSGIPARAARPINCSLTSCPPAGGFMAPCPGERPARRPRAPGCRVPARAFTFQALAGVWTVEARKRGGQDHECSDVLHPRRVFGQPEAVPPDEDRKNPDLLWRNVVAGGVVRPFAREQRQVPDPEGGDGVEGEALPQVLRVVGPPEHPCLVSRGFRASSAVSSHFSPFSHRRVPLASCRCRNRCVQGPSASVLRQDVREDHHDQPASGGPAHLPEPPVHRLHVRNPRHGRHRRQIHHVAGPAPPAADAPRP